MSTDNTRTDTIRLRIVEFRGMNKDRAHLVTCRRLGDGQFACRMHGSDKEKIVAGPNEALLFCRMVDATLVRGLTQADLDAAKETR